MARDPVKVPGRMSPDARRAQLLGVALDLFAERGYHATSITHIIEKASVARGTFQHGLLLVRLVDHLGVAR